MHLFTFSYTFKCLDSVVRGSDAQCTAVSIDSATYHGLRTSAKAILEVTQWSGTDPMLTRSTLCLDMFTVSRWRPYHALATWHESRIQLGQSKSR